MSPAVALRSRGRQLPALAVILELPAAAAKISKLVVAPRTQMAQQYLLPAMRSALMVAVVRGQKFPAKVEAALRAIGFRYPARAPRWFVR